MIEFEIGTKRFREIIKAVSINGLIEIPTIQFLPDRLRAVNIDLAGAVMSYASFNKSYFTKYDIKDETRISFESEKLLKISKLLTDEMTKVQINTDRDQVKISTKMQEVTVPIMKSPIRETNLPRFIEEKDGILEITQPFTITEKIPILKQEAKSLEQEETMFIIKNNILSAQQKTTDGYSFAYNLKTIQAVDFSVMASASYLGAMFDSVISEEVELKLSKEDPIVIIDKTADFDIMMILAPRME